MVNVNFIILICDRIYMHFVHIKYRSMPNLNPNINIITGNEDYYTTSDDVYIVYICVINIQFMSANDDMVIYF